MPAAPGHAPDDLAAADAARGHLPILADRIVELLAPGAGDVVVDATFGAGGHSRRLAAAMQDRGTLVAIDRDPAARRRVAAFAADVAPIRVQDVAEDFAGALEQLAADRPGSVDAILLDVGVSSMQLDDPGRGFAYAADGPLDMRMDPTVGPSAAELVAELEPAQLERVLREYGEERQARRIVRELVRRRERGEAPKTTGELVDAIRAALPAGGRASKGGHPAKRTFQALRIAANDELGQLDRALEAAIELLAPGGRLAVLAFHSLEDRLVKRRFADWAGRCTCPPGLPTCGCGAVSRVELLTRGAEQPGEDEVARNPRAGSARLRAVRLREEAVPITELDGGGGRR